LVHNFSVEKIIIINAHEQNSQTVLFDTTALSALAGQVEVCWHST